MILDRDLAALYGVTTSNLNKAVSRNLDRFPSDFMLQLTLEELGNLKFQFGTSSWGGTRKSPRAFREQGVATLSSVPRSTRAVRVNIEIMRTRGCGGSCCGKRQYKGQRPRMGTMSPSRSEKAARKY